jgi:hypothetical protein
MKKFAVCFSGYPRFVKLCFDNIKEDFLDGLGEYDIYANFQWNEDWQNTKIHHEFKDTYTTNEIDDFIELYTPLNLKDIKINKPFEYDTSNYNKLSVESDLHINLDLSRDILYRMKSQYQGIVDCVKLADSSEYEFFVRIRTDMVFNSKLNFSQLESNHILCQNGYVAGWDRHFSDWFLIVPSTQIKFFDDLANLEEHFSEGIVHMHKLIEKVGKPYNIQSYQFGANIPSTTKKYIFLKNKK